MDICYVQKWLVVASVIALCVVFMCRINSCVSNQQFACGKLSWRLLGKTFMCSYQAAGVDTRALRLFVSVRNAGLSGRHRARSIDLHVHKHF